MPDNSAANGSVIITGASSGIGVTVNVSSLASRTGSPNEYIDYAASIGALDTMTIGLAKEVANDGIRVPGSSTRQCTRKAESPVVLNDLKIACRCSAVVDPRRWVR